MIKCPDSAQAFLPPTRCTGVMVELCVTCPRAGHTLPGLPVAAQGWTWPPGGNDSQDKTRQEAATESFSECRERCVWCVQYVRCDLWCEVCSVQCCMWWGDMILTHIHGGDRLVTAVTSKRLAMGGSRKSSRLVSRSSKACPLPGTKWLQPFPWSKCGNGTYLLW